MENVGCLLLVRSCAPLSGHDLDKQKNALFIPFLVINLEEDCRRKCSKLLFQTFIKILYGHSLSSNLLRLSSTIVGTLERQGATKSCGFKANSCVQRRSRSSCDWSWPCPGMAALVIRMVAPWRPFKVFLKLRCGHNMPQHVPRVVYVVWYSLVFSKSRSHLLCLDRNGSYSLE